MASRLGWLLFAVACVGAYLRRHEPDDRITTALKDAGMYIPAMITMGGIIAVLFFWSGILWLTACRGQRKVDKLKADIERLEAQIATVPDEKLRVENFTLTKGTIRPRS